MKICTKLGMALLVMLFTTGVIWAQSSANDVSPNISTKSIASDALFDLQFDWPTGNSSGEAGIETDGIYVYTTLWNGTQFCKYDMSGNYLGVFSCGSAAAIRDLAYDGTYFYGAAAATTVFQMDFNSQTLVSSFTAPIAVRAIAYNEDENCFYGNNWSDAITKFDMTGANLGSFACGPNGSSYYGFAYDNYSDGAPYLWGYAQAGTNMNQLIQIALPSGTETGTSADLATIITIAAGNLAGGLAISNTMVSGYYTLLGIVQNADIWGLELCPSSVNPNAIFSDDFEAYTAGQQAACQNPTDWTTWSNLPCDATEDPYVSDLYAHSGANSVVIAQNNDFVKDFGDPYTTGKYSISFYAYIPTGGTGYFNTLQLFDGSSSVWGLEVYFNAAGAGSINANGTGTATFTWTPDTWFMVENIVDLDMDNAEIWIDGNMIYSYQWSLGATGTGQNTLEANDFFGNLATDALYIDDYTLANVAPPPLNPPTNLTATVADNDVHLAWQAPSSGQVGSVLVVDRDGSGGTLGFTDDWQYIQPALDNLGIDYTYYEVLDLTQNGPDLATMQQADVIIWLTGEAWQSNQTMSNADETNLAAYLDGGGSLLLSAMDYFYDKYPSAGSFSPGQFPYDYLGVSSTSQDFWSVISPSLASVSGVTGSFAEGLNFQATDIYTTDKDGLYIDQIVGMGQDLFQVTSPTPSGIAALQYDGGTFRTAFTTVSIAAITDPSIIESVLSGAINWLSNSDADALLGYNVYRDGTMIDYTTDTQYDDMDLASGTYEYYVTAVYDEGESAPSNNVSATIAAAGAFTDDFENYIAGQQVACQNPVGWTTWSNAPCGDEDAYISTEQAYSGVNSALIEGINDFVHVIPNYTTSRYTISFEMYVPSGYVGYFNTLQSFAGGSSQYGMQVYFDVGGAGSTDAGAAASATFVFPYDTWMLNEIIIDLDNDEADYYIDGNLIVSWVWSSGPFGTGTLDQLGGNDFYAWTGASGTDVPKYFIDDYSVLETPIGIVTHSIDPISAYPNPATDVVNIKSDNTITSVKIFNYTGQMVASEKVDNNIYQFNTSKLNTGIYFFQVETTQGVTTKRIIIE